MIFDRESAQLMSAILCASRHGDKVSFITSQRKLQYITDLAIKLHRMYAIRPERSMVDRVYVYASGGRLEICSTGMDIDTMKGQEITTAWFDELGESIDEQRLVQVVLDRVSRKRNTRNKNP